MTLFATIATLISGCALSATPTINPTPPVPAAGIGLGHIHGLGVDSDTSTVYVATHGGVFAVSTDIGRTTPSMNELTSPIADRAQDTMGFTLLDGTMYGSGHPDPLNAEDDPADLGLIISSDKAQSWQSISLRGEVDFHDIAAARGPDGAVLLHGYSATTGAVMTSHDTGRTWIQGATIAARDLAVNEDEGSALYATTESGLIVSTDGGATFVALPDAPPLYLVESLNDGAGGLIGVDTSGQIWVKSTGTWQNTGTVAGSAEALTYSSAAGLLVIADEQGIRSSDDHGASWQALLLR